MGWYNSGAWVGLRVDRTGHLLHQMCYAVNEREAAIGRTLSTWGGRGAYAAPSKFDGIRLDRRCEVLQLIREALPSLYDVGEDNRFVQASGANWTEAALLTAAGYGTSWLELNGARVDDASAWLQLRGAIEALLYHRDPAVLSIANARGYTMVTKNANGFTTAQLAYNDALTNMLTLDLSDWRIRYIPAYNVGTSRYGYNITKKLTFHVGFSGAATPSNFILLFKDDVDDPNGLGGPDPIPMAINGVSGFDLVRSSHGYDLVSVHVGVDVPIGSYYTKNTILGTDVTFETTPPATHPGKVNTSGQRSARFAELYTSGGFETVNVETITGLTYG